MYTKTITSKKLNDFLLQNDFNLTFDGLFLRLTTDKMVLDF